MSLTLLCPGFRPGNIGRCINMHKKKKSDLFWTKLNQLDINVSLILMQDVDFGTAAFNGGLKSVNSLVNRLKTG